MLGQMHDYKTPTTPVSLIHTLHRFIGTGSPAFPPSFPVLSKVNFAGLLSLHKHLDYHYRLYQKKARVPWRRGDERK